MTSVSFLQKVAATIKRHQMAEPEDRILVGVSGGADSVCLARTLDELGYSLGIAHVNHGLRGGDSDRDERFVRDLASELGVPFFGTGFRADQFRGNLEAVGRTFRRDFFRGLLDREGFRKVALAHSRDDRNETFLLHLLRGSGTGGLVSMQPASDWLVRPLIEVTRSEIEAHLSDLGQQWRTDESNDDVRFARNKIRHELLPRLSADFNPRLDETLWRTTEILSAENEWMEHLARKWFTAHFSSHRSAPPIDQFVIQDPNPTLEIGDLRDQPVGLVRRVLRMALVEAGSDLRDVSFDHLEHIRRLLGPGKSGRVVELPGAIDVLRSFDTLVFSPAPSVQSNYEYELRIPGHVQIPEAGCGFRARLVEPTSLESADPGARVWVDGESLGPYVKIRNWKNGDTYEPIGLGKSKLKTLFQERRIPRTTRRRWPVFVTRSSIVWVASFPVALDFVPTAESTRIIEFEAFSTTGDPTPSEQGRRKPFADRGV